MEEARVEKKTGFFTRVKAEFKKIIWPDKKSFVKQVTAVVILSVLIGTIVAILDMVIKFGLSFIL